jgi:hypothetical protein
VITCVRSRTHAGSARPYGPPDHPRAARRGAPAPKDRHMARIVLEVSRAVLERLARATPISFNGQPDVLDPPFSFDKMTDSVHANLIARSP